MNLDKVKLIVAKNNNLQSIKITNGWKVRWNHFVSADPLMLDDDSPEWACFSEDMAYFQNEKYEIDLGWYGGLNKNGFYGISLLNDGKVIETFQSKSIDEITIVLNYFFSVPYL